jgi:hypothetical protein
MLPDRLPPQAGSPTHIHYRYIKTLSCLQSCPDFRGEMICMGTKDNYESLDSGIRH